MPDEIPAGWYADPYGTPDLLRWWDGRTWTEHTHPTPSGPAQSGPILSGPILAGPAPESAAVSGPQATGAGYPVPAAQDPGPAAPADPVGSLWPADGAPAEPPMPGAIPAGRGNAALPWVLAAAGALVVVIVAVAVLYVTGVFGGSNGEAASAGTQGGQTGQGGPAPTSAPPTPGAPSGSPAPTGTHGAHGMLRDPAAGLSYRDPGDGWANAMGSGSLSAVSWTNQLVKTVQRKVTGPMSTWVATVDTGRLTSAVHYSNPGDLHKAVKKVAGQIKGTYYDLPKKMTHHGIRAVTVDKHKAWRVDFSYHYTKASAEHLVFHNESAAVLVIDTGGGKAAVFYMSVPDSLPTSLIDTTISSLQVL